MHRGRLRRGVLLVEQPQLLSEQLRLLFRLGLEAGDVLHLGLESSQRLLLLRANLLVPLSGRRGRRGGRAAAGCLWLVGH